MYIICQLFWKAFDIFKYNFLFTMQLFDVVFCGDMIERFSAREWP